MPEISRFLGIKNLLYFNEDNPPHFHIQYNKNQKELLENWNSMKITGEYIKIKPLV